MDVALETWEQEVRAAAMAGDRAALKRLYERGREQFGSAADHAWSEALAAFDGTAVTG